MVTEASALVTLQLAKVTIDFVILVYSNSKRPPPPSEADLNSDLNFIKDEFEMMSAYLAQGSGYQNIVARQWIRQVRNLAYDVEDYFQEFHVHLKSTSNTSSSSRKDVVNKIRGLKKRIQETNQRYKDFFQTSTLATGGVGQPELPTEALLVGRDTEKANIINIVTKDDKHRQIIPIWGMGGLGKTALARSIYEKRHTFGIFNMSAWLTLSRSFKVEEVLRNLIVELEKADLTVKENLKKMNPEDLIRELNRLLYNENYLIVLDNVSSIEDWKNLIQLFQDEQCTSRIIVTTRDRSVAEHCSRENMYKLEGLKDDAALELFKKKVLTGTTHFVEQPEIIEQAKNILLKCCGLPLAICTIGGFLATKPRTIQQWANFNENFYLELDRNSSLNILKTSLASHCMDLPYHLKLCVLYLSVFCEDNDMIRRRRLIRRWIAEGYLGDTITEKNGEDYITELINKSIIQPLEPVDVGGVATRYCHVHSLLRRIIFAQSMEEGICFVLGSRSSNSQTRAIVRHLSISCSWRRDANDLESIGDISHVRSLTACGNWEPAPKLEKMRMLRVLDLEGTGGLLRDHHIELYLNKLLNLKYLSLRGCYEIFWLTHSLGDLLHLQTLDVRDTSIIILPESTVGLQQIQYLRAGKTPKDEQPRDCTGLAEPKAKTGPTFFGLMNDTIVNAFRLEPKDSGETSKRDKFNRIFFYDGYLLNPTRDKHGIEVPPKIGNVKSLETLGVIDVGAMKNTSLKLMELTKLRKLGVTGLKRENSQQFFTAIESLTLLQSLSIRSEGIPGLQACFDGKSPLPPLNLRSLKLYGNLATLPSWILQLQNLAKLKLRSTRLGQDAIQVLGSLPRLTILRLMSNSIEGKGLHFHFQRGSFLSLVLLQLDGLPDLQSLKFEHGATPNLESLQVENCNHIEKHTCSGLSFRPSLRAVFL